MTKKPELTGMAYLLEHAEFTTKEAHECTEALRGLLERRNMAIERAAAIRKGDGE